MTGSLYVVATPIGNLKDLSQRARDVLANCEAVAAEDTRHSGRLLAHLGISTPMISLHEHNEARVAEDLVRRLGAGERIALISDAGTPLISDPGYRLVQRARERGIEVLPVPGPCALTAALSVAGLPTDRFLFAGFPPNRKTARREALASLADETVTLVFYESSHRIAATLTDCVVAFGAERPAFLGREMTKLHEQYVAAPLAALSDALEAGDIPTRGEFVIVIGGCAEPRVAEQARAAELLRVLLRELAPAQAARLAAAYTGLPRRQCYDLARRAKGPSD